MNRHRWESCTLPEPLLDFVLASASERKLRLLLCAACRRIPEIMADPLASRAVALGEALADGRADLGERRAVWQALGRAASRRFSLSVIDGPGQQLARAVASASSGCVEVVDDLGLFQAAGGHRHLWPSRLQAVGGALAAAIACRAFQARQRGEAPAEDAHAVKAAEGATQAELIHDLFAPFECRAFEQAWRTIDVVAVARGAYLERDWGRLPVLADALEEAGCGWEALVAHLRGPGAHVPGCWAVDRVLGLA